MNVYTCTDFCGHYPVGTSAIVVAENLEFAWAQLLTKLNEIGLPQDGPLTLVKVDTETPSTTVLQNGDY